MKMKLVLSCIVVCIIGSLFGCSEKPEALIKLDFDKYEAIRLNKDDPILYVTLLHAYKFSYDRNHEKPTKANLFVCREIDARDSMFVLDFSERSDGGIFDKKNQNQGFILNMEESSQYKGQSIAVEIPPNFKIPKNIRYAVGGLNEMLD